MKDLLSIREKPEKILLRTMSENPAFEWNSRRRLDREAKPSLILHPVIQSVGFKLNFAPAIVYRKLDGSTVQETLVSGISGEFNVFTDIRIFMSFQQLEFFNSIILHGTSISSKQNSASEENSKIFPPKEISVPGEVLLTCSNVKLVIYNEVEHLLEPLMMITITQPHIFSVISQGTQKMTLSLYTLQLSAPDPGTAMEPDQLMKLEELTNVILESRPALADVVSGIKPPFLNLIMEGFLGPQLSVNCSMARPLQVNLDPDVMQLVSSSLLKPQDQSKLKTEKAPLNLAFSEVNLKCSMISTSVLLRLKAEKSTSFTYALSSVTASSRVKFLEDRINVEADTLIDNLRCSFDYGGDKYSLIDPVSLNITASASSDLYLQPDKGSLIIATGKSNIHLGPVQLFLLDQYAAFINTEIQKKSGNENAQDIKIEEDFSSVGEHFADDLRLGAFTVEKESVDIEIPLPYKVIYNKNSLTWTYPKPRTLTKMMILPLPLTLAKEGDYSADSVSCQLQFWSSNRSCWILYTHFQLQEGNVCHVDLPLCTDKRSCEFSSTWRIQMFSDGNIRDEIPCSLLSALRVDSYFSDAMLPAYQFVVHVKHIDLTLHNQLDYCGKKLEGDLAGLVLSEQCPKNQPFISFKVDGLSTELSVWSGQKTKESSLKAIVRGRLGIEYIDYCYLAKHSLLVPSDLCLKLQVQENFIDVFTDIGRAEFSIGPFGLHTLLQSAKIWKQTEYYLSTGELAQSFIPLTQILIQNNSCQALIIGQAGTDEQICIDERGVYMYAWRSHKAGSMLRLSTGRKSTTWSSPFPVQAGETEVCIDDIIVVVEIVQRSTTLTIVQLSGLVTVVNLLQDHLEVKLIHEHFDDCKVLSGSCERPVSLLPKNGYKGLKVKLFGVSSPWSGEICLNNTRKFSLLRLPLQEKGCNTTIWCNILKDNSKLLVAMSPMYVLHSQLPGQLTTHIEGEACGGDLALSGFNASCQLDVQQAPENKFNLSFQVNQAADISSPPVSVSWGIIDQVRTSRPYKLSMKLVLEEMSKINLKKISSAPEINELSQCTAVEDSGTDCQVKFEEIHPFINTLRIKVQAKLLFRNSTNSDLVFSCSGGCWYLGPNSLLHSPTADTFRFGVLMNTGEEHFGSTLEITDHDWTYVSLLPNHDKIIPKFGHMIYQIKCGDQVLMLNIQSVIAEGMRIITLQAMFVFTNQLDQPVEVEPAILGRKSLTIQYGQEEQEADGPASWQVDPGAQAQGLLWNLADRGDGKPEFQLILNFPGSSSSKKVCVSTDNDMRQSFCLPSGELSVVPCILINHSVDGVVHLVCFKDERPQFHLVNKINKDVQFREVSGKFNVAVKAGGSTFYTCSYVEDAYPYIQEDHDRNRITFSEANTSSDATGNNI